MPREHGGGAQFTIAISYSGDGQIFGNTETLGRKSTCWWYVVSMEFTPSKTEGLLTVDLVFHILNDFYICNKISS